MLFWAGFCLHFSVLSCLILQHVMLVTGAPQCVSCEILWTVTLWSWNRFLQMSVEFFVTELLNFSLNFHLIWRYWLNWDKNCRSCVLHCGPTPFLLWEKECTIQWAAIGWLFWKHTHWTGKEMPASRACSAFLLKSEFILSETDYFYHRRFIQCYS